jgi:hypothetical protein
VGVPRKRKRKRKRKRNDPNHNPPVVVVLYHPHHPHRKPHLRDILVKVSIPELMFGNGRHGIDSL